MQKAYGSRINWENYPSEATPVNATNLNRMDAALYEIDDRVIALYTTKLDVEAANDLIEDINVNTENGNITLTYRDHTTKVIQTNLAKIALNWSYDYNTQRLILTLSDGTQTYIDLSSLIQNNEFTDSSTIAFDLVGNNVTAGIKAHSITDEHLRTDYLADIRVSEANAAQSESDAEAQAIRSQSYAVGGTESRTGEDTDNAKYYSQLADSSRQAAEVSKTDAENLVAVATSRLTNLTVQVSLSDGHLYYDAPSGLVLQVNNDTGALMYDVSVA